MNEWMARRLAGLRPGSPQGCGGMVMVPLLATAGPPWDEPGPRPMPEAMARGELLVTEVGASGVMGEVRAENLGDHPVLMLEGEEWSGGRQNRVLVASVLLRPRASARIPVACSEPGRWHYLGSGSGPAFGDSGAVLPPSLRGAARMARMQRTRGAWGHGEDAREAVQAAVEVGLEAWRTRLGEGRSLGECQAREAARRPAMEFLFPWVPCQVGWLFALQGEWHAMEILPSPAACRRWHRKLVRGVLASPCGGALAPEAVAFPAAVAADWRQRACVALQDAAKARGFRSNGIDLGELEEHRSATWVGGALIVHDHVVHAGWQGRSPILASSPVPAGATGLRLPG